MARIISVDDDDLISAAISATLGAEGHIVGTIRNGALALDTIRLRLPDLVILDCALPGMPGIEVLRRLRGDSTTYLMSVIMLTGHRRESDIDAALEAGANEYITKPFEPADLIARVESVLAANSLRLAGQNGDAVNRAGQRGD